MTRVIRIAEYLLLAVVVAYAAVVVRDYSRYASHYPYLAVDDSVGNVSYSLATVGRYGFMASPVQGFTDLLRDRAFFSYGPWYFYAGAALIWLFGYDLAILRAMHLGAIVAIAAAGLWWFGRRGHLAAGALVAVGLLHSFTLGQWPMVRPDIAVSIFAVLFIVSAGLAIEKRWVGWWFVAGLAAGCAALQHLIAAAMVPCCLGTFVIALASERPTKRRAAIALLAVLLGLVTATVMFYASFGFRIRDHVESLRAYSGYLGTTQTAGAGPRAVIAEHLRMAFWYLSPAAQVALGGAFVASLGLVAAAWRLHDDARRRILTLLLPPAAVLLFYGVSLGSYPNYHTGYVILLQVSAWWCAGALVSTLLSHAEGWLSPSRRLAGPVVALILVGAGSIQLLVGSEPNPRLALTRTWVDIQGYIDKVNELMPVGASVWGTGIHGIDSPGRLDLIEVVDGITLTWRARRAGVAVDSLMVAPQYVLWDYPVNRDNTLQAFRGSGLGLDRRRNTFDFVIGLLPSVRYRLVGLIAAPPYGVTRVYQRVVSPEDGPARLPAVSFYDVATQSWEERLEGPIAASFAPAAPVTFNIDYTPKQPAPADRSVVAELPPGRYMLRVRVGPTSGPTRPIVVSATSVPSITETIGELGPSIDSGPYAVGDRESYIVHEHAGGPVYVSQFDNGQGASIDGVEVYRIRPTLYDDQRAERIFRALPPLASWVPLASGGINARIADSGALVVEGDASRQGYQIQSPVLPATRRTGVTIRTAFAQEQGTVCLGALNATGERWLANGGDPARDFTFAMGDATSFRLVYYNCHPTDAGNVSSRFAVSNARYAVNLPGYYVDQLFAALDAETAPAAMPDPRVRSFPSGLAVSADQIEGAGTPVQSTDLQFHARIATIAGNGWTIRGKADGKFSYLLRSKPQQVDEAVRLVVKGRVQRGGLTVGLLKNDQWAGQVNVTSAGEFIVVIEPAGSGTYDIVVANNLPEGSLETDVVVSEMGWVPR